MAEIVILLGAGASLADATARPQRDQPPLDRGFFRGLRRAGLESSTDVQIVRTYLRSHYAQDLFDSETDSFEQVLAIVYADIYGGPNKSQAEAAFRAMLRILHRRIVRTTNSLDPRSKSRLYRMIVKLMNQGVAPQDIVVITYNYDLQAEKVLKAIAQTGRWTRAHRTIWSFPYCYGLPAPRLSRAPARSPQFERAEEDEGGISLLKLHGSLNWFSKHISRQPSARTLLDPNRELMITPRSVLEPEMSFTAARRMYTFPIIVPPVLNKAAILHSELRGVWDLAQEALQTAREIIVFGYSCPLSDAETANMISRSCRKNGSIRGIDVINPDPLVFIRYVSVTGYDRLSYYRYCDSYLRAG